ncbi:MAG: hypothetical protein FWC71_00210 [Defluviitaleaceae bacterium]|nr:hypothetical protein [Defluviitaleaceae bacterium]
MVEKMTYVNIVGHIGSMNHVVNRYFSRYDIQLEPGETHSEMEPFSTSNPYAATLQKAERFMLMMGHTPPILPSMDTAEAVNLVEDAYRLYEAREEALRAREHAMTQMEEYLARIAPFTAIIDDLRKLGESTFLHYKCGRLDTVHYKQFETFKHEDEKIIFIPTQRNAESVWGVYFTPMQHAQTVDAIFAGFNFEVISLEGEGSAAARGRLAQEVRSLSQETLARLVIEGVNPMRLFAACAHVRTLYKKFDVKKYARLSRGRRVFAFSGWMGADDANALDKEMQADNLLLFTLGESNAGAPTRLRNWPVVRQFEFFTLMYGLPSYGEADPTFVLAVTYTLLFGLMFGDVGHGMVLAALGAVLLWIHRKPLGGIVAVVGVSAMAFGFLYGSIFGVETMLPALWRRPAQDITGMLLFAVGLGVVLVVISMGIHMYNALCRSDVGAFIFSANGLAGLLFYGTVVFGAVQVWGMEGAFPWWVLSFPLLLLAAKFPLEAWMAGRSVIPEGGVGAFIFRTVMEIFETLLTYLTNTISFVRVGAFAISHAGMMHVVVQLSQGTRGASSLIIFILGNALVIIIEGLLVAIQALRLDFYEIFSRFYRGGGRVFSSHKISGSDNPHRIKGAERR